MEKAYQLQLGTNALDLYHLSVVETQRNLLHYVSDTIPRSVGVGDTEFWIVEKCLELHSIGKPCSAAAIVPHDLPRDVRLKILKSVHAAFRRLVARGIAKKVGRGLYIVNPGIYYRYRNGIVHQPVAGSQRNAVGLVSESGILLVRLHSTFSRFVDVWRGVEIFFVRLCVYRYLVDYLVSWLESYLRSRGWSKSRIKKLKRFARSIAEEVKRRARILFGIHGFRLRFSDGSAKHFKKFVSLELFEALIRREFRGLLELYEMGIDMIIDASTLCVDGYGLGLGYVDLDELIGFGKIYAERFKSLNAYIAS